MRKVSILTMTLCALALAPGAEAQEKPVADQFKDALNVYYGGKTSIEDYLAGYRDFVLAGAEGLWMGITPDLAKEDLSTVLVRGCSKSGMRVERTSDYTFTMTRNPDSETPVRYTYVSMGGSVFSVQVNPEQLFDWMSPPGGEAPSGARTTALYYASGIAAIYRPSPDILVIHANFSVPQVYVRCP